MNTPIDTEDSQMRVVAYHEIHDVTVNDVYCITPELFLQHLWTMRDAARDTLESLVITFDDGHYSNFQFAAPILESTALRGLFFLPSTWIGNRREFMSWDDVRNLASRGHRIGSHSATHAFLPSCSAAAMYEELAGSRHTLEDRLGAPVTSISMPGGRWNEMVLRACALAGYETVYTSEPGFYRPAMDTEQFRTPAVIGRFAVQRRTSLRAISGYAGGDWRTVRRIHSMYQARNGVKRLLGDDAYQKLWSHLFRATPN
ncbi:polysaccharide deacetylase family protein [Terriglobus sp. TAA 43]|uniref:polysaccharide deacetylase family protein n=1 Tax=Terriglobus sp. TAA 43 TaxID=278961 RepID=UPI000648F1BA|nr:polysaccharide deacetylase family protein [Terriglobus sp. TAA 43]